MPLLVKLLTGRARAVATTLDRVHLHYSLVCFYSFWCCSSSQTRFAKFFASYFITEPGHLREAARDYPLVALARAIELFDFSHFDSRESNVGRSLLSEQC